MSDADKKFELVPVLALVSRFGTSEQSIAFVKAQVVAQQAMGNVEKDSANPHLKNKYASLKAVLEVVRPALSTNGILIRQPSSFVKRLDGVVLLTETRLYHVEGAGEVFTAEMGVKWPMSAQEQGSAISYNRRYSLMGIFSLAAEDDDGNEASGTRGPKSKGSAEDPEEAQYKLWLTSIDGAAKDRDRLLKAADKVMGSNLSEKYRSKLLGRIEWLLKAPSDIKP